MSPSPKGQVTPTNATLGAKVGQPITLRVTSDANDELHVHSSPDHKFQVAAAPNQTFQFKVDVPGNVEGNCTTWTARSRPSKSSRDPAVVSRTASAGPAIFRSPTPMRWSAPPGALTFTFALVAFARRRPR